LQLPDFLNGSLELVCAGMLYLDVRTLLKHKTVQGISIIARTFFWGWSIWNLWWYPHLHQTFSFVGALAVMLPQTFWLGMLIRYKTKKE
jgi:hypothetical protein